MHVEAVHVLQFPIAVVLPAEHQNEVGVSAIVDLLFRLGVGLGGVARPRRVACVVVGERGSPALH
eukprot:scaffold128_cov248-Pinguiococcus_pyrenoidosus.AAC.29